MFAVRLHACDVTDQTATGCYFIYRGVYRWKFYLKYNKKKSPGTWVLQLWYPQVTVVLHQSVYLYVGLRISQEYSIRPESQERLHQSTYLGAKPRHA